MAKKRDPFEVWNDGRIRQPGHLPDQRRSGYINGDAVTMDGGEWLQGAGEFTALGREFTEKEWEMMKPKKKEPKI